MTKREFIKFFAKLFVTVGVVFILYQNHFTVSTGGTVSVLVFMALMYVFFRNYKDIKDWCLETMLRLRVSDNMRIKTPRRELFAWLFIWIHIVLPVALLYFFTIYLENTQQSMEDSAFSILIIVGIGAGIAFGSLFADNNN